MRTLKMKGEKMAKETEESERLREEERKKEKEADYL